MPNDFITINALARELNQKLSGSKIDKIFQPSRDEVTFSVRSRGENVLLYFSANPSLPTVYVTKRKFTNPENAPAFCMHLRKRLTHSIIDEISTFNNDRIVQINLTSRDELQFEVKYALYFEITGRYVNLILTEDGKITDALRHVFPEDSDRPVLPGLRYLPPEPRRVAVSDLCAVRKILSSTECGRVSEVLLEHTSGLARSTAEFISTDELPLSQDKIAGIVDKIGDLINSDRYFSPVVEMKNGAVNEFFICPYFEGEFEHFSSLSDAIDYATFERKSAEKLLARGRRIRTAIKNALSRNEKKLSINENKVLDGANAEEDRITAELITSNIYRIERGSSEVILDNYYSGEKLTVKLDPLLSPQKNAQKLYSRYAKKKRAVEIATEQIREIKENTAYLESILVSLNNALTVQDLEDVETELLLGGYLSDGKATRKKNDSMSRPIEYRFMGTQIFVGKNNLQNDRLTFKSAINSDLWFHVKAFHGSHVVVRLGREPSSEIVQFAAELAAYFSEAKGSAKVEVDYTRIKNVKRHPSQRPGLVTYTDYKTVNVTPNRHEDYIKK